MSLSADLPQLDSILLVDRDLKQGPPCRYAHKPLRCQQLFRRVTHHATIADAHDGVCAWRPVRHRCRSMSGKDGLILTAVVSVSGSSYRFVVSAKLH